MPILKQKTLTTVSWLNQDFSCQVGKNGFVIHKKEGDLSTPTGCFEFLKVFFRADKMEVPKTILPVFKITPNMGWSDDVNDPLYNQAVELPHPFSHEKLWREDEIYDLLIVTSHNTNPTISGDGSAVFIHLMRPEKSPTAGCLALKRQDLLYILETATLDSAWEVGECLA